MAVTGRWLSYLVVLLVTWAACGEDETGDGGDTATEAFVPPDVTDETRDTSMAPEVAETRDTATAAEADGDEDTAPLPGEFGAPCQGNPDCLSGYCVEGPTGFVCTRTCDTTCPAGWDCRGVAGEIDIVFLCQPRVDRFCAPCADDTQCPGGFCGDLDGERRCLRACGEGDRCPDETTCAGGSCVPATGSCGCWAEADGGLRTCRRESEHGTCFGIEDCDPSSGWGECSARTPQAETCNGEDDDCNAFVDDGIAAVGGACEVEVAGVGSCAGETICAGRDGLECQGPTPKVESCNFEDDDCDGAIDEDMKVGDVYALFEHCGTCHRSCAEGLPNAAETRCEVRQAVAQCVVVTCEDGYIKQNDFQCIPDIVNLCEACADDTNCLGQGSACVTLSDGKFCAKACEDGGDCPAGFGCQVVVGVAAKQCLPTTGVCSCGAGTIGLGRPCSVTVTPAGQPSYTCAGTETCGAGGWGSCALPTEVCNGVDDDCSGVADEPYRDGEGRYVRVEHCGACGVSCLALTFANAAPVCDVDAGSIPRCGYACSGAYVDVDGQPGCECLPTNASDVPDGGGEDADCDGIDGEIEKSVFVAKTGDDGGAGTIGDPLRTIQAGIDKAVLLGRRDVLVATGVYEESIALKNGVSVYGGYAPGFSERAITTHETAILGEPPTDAERGAVNLGGVGTTAGTNLTFDGFSVFGADNPAPSGNSYAIYLRDSGPFVTISNNYVVAGNGGAGSPGSKGSDGVAGTNGGAGVGSIQLASGAACSPESHASGGAGGPRQCGDAATNGGAGGTRVCPVVTSSVQTLIQVPLAVEHGQGGANNTGGFGSGGEAGWHERVQNTACSTVSSPLEHDAFGATGRSGAAGANAASSVACVATAGALDAAGHWQGSVAGVGGIAGHGGGGGGGGSAGGIDHISTCGSVAYVLGGSGGGGGAGGCAGGSGQPGRTGGGAFAIFLAYGAAPTALPTILGNRIVGGRGGRGGDGGAGGVGGAGGFGGDGGPTNRGSAGSGAFPQYCCGSGGGAGGNGGAGGHGAGGAGGCGGTSIGIYIAPVALTLPRTNMRDNTIVESGTGGGGGFGGTSLGNTGSNGGTGLSSAANF